ncbi:MAG: hypothetical protein R3320_12940 [Nitriliruptorales bacterium]|nr:hypothetical protein [Nitriliruptorales bacterium]
MPRGRAVAAIVGLVVTLSAVALSSFSRVVNAPSSAVPIDDFVWLAGYAAFAAVGAVVMIKRPEHPIGGMFVLLGVFGGVAEAAVGLATLPAVSNTTTGSLAGWVSAWVWAPSLGLIVWSVILFPTGRPLNRFFGVIGRAALGLTVSISGVNAVGLWPHRSAELAVLDAELEASVPAFVVNFLGAVFPLVLLCALVAMVSLLVRYRRSVGTERQQLKWIALVALTGGSALVLSELVFVDGGPKALLNIVSAPAWLGVAAGIAVLRYRLYDIDRVISRTLSYALITAILVGIYAGGVLGLGALGRTVTGESGELVVALSTLVVAALFAPVRRRVQTTIDRRFNRARSDALRMLSEFGGQLRDEVDLPHLRREVEGVAHRVFQPTSVALWVPGRQT